MAKKGQVVQIQTEINTDEEWEKFLQRDGLLVVDIYSEWCGPCSAMQGVLKKIKMEVGGDFLHLGIAKADGIKALSRFIDKSEPTWMFIAQGNMVQLLFGTNSPVLQRMVLDEMKKEKDCLAGDRSRVTRTPEEYSDEERVRYEARDKINKERDRILQDKLHKQLSERKMAQAKNILDTMAHVGLILIWPHAVRKALEVLESFMENAPISISKKEKPALTELAMEDIEFFSPFKIPHSSRKALYIDKCLALMIVQEETASTPIDDAVLKFVYGNSKCPPGDKECPHAALLKVREVKIKFSVKEPTKSKMSRVNASDSQREISEEQKARLAVLSSVGILHLDDEGPLPEIKPEDDEEDDEPDEDVWGCWAPANDLVKATALKYFFPLITAPLILPEPEPIPPHIVISFDAWKRKEVLALAQEHPDDVMSFGFFTDENCDTAKLIAKSKSKFEKTADQTALGEKLILKVSRKHSDTMLAFAQLGPTYISPNVEEGERECAIFFPEGFTQDPEIVEEEVKPPPKKSKKKKTSVEAEGELTGETVREEGAAPEGAGVVGGEAVAEGEAPPVGEGEAPPVGEGEVPPTGEGAVPPGGEGGAPPGAEGAVPSSGEGAAPPAGEGGAPPGAEGAAPPTSEGAPPPAAESAAPAGEQEAVEQPQEVGAGGMTELPPVDEAEAGGGDVPPPEEVPESVMTELPPVEESEDKATSPLPETEAEG